MNNRLQYFFFILLISFQLAACRSSDQNESVSSYKSKPINVIFDTDMGSDCDDAGALALLHHFADLEEVNILGCIYGSGKVPYGAGVIDAINHYYGLGHIPIGAAQDTLVGDPIDKMGAALLAVDTIRYGHDIVHNMDALDQTQLNRKLLTMEDDNSIVYVTVGHTKGLYDLLLSSPDSISPLTGEQLIAQKIKSWIALGALEANNSEGTLKKDWNFFFNGTADYTEYLIKNFPGQIYFVDGGSTVMTGKSLEKTPDSNIVKRAYTDWLQWYGDKTLADQRPSWDLVTIYYAVKGLGEYLMENEEGWLDFDADEGCVWRKEENPYQHHYIYQKVGIDSLFAAELNEKISQLPNLK